MKKRFALFLGAMVLFSMKANSQCKADSVFTYAVIGGVNTVTGIEYFKYDENDSVVQSNLIEIQNGKAVPVNLIERKYSKIKGGSRIEYVQSSWNSERGIYKLETIYTMDISKSGLVINEKFDRFENGNVVPETTVKYLYNKNNELISKTFLRWNPSTANWINLSCVTYSYTNGNQTESISFSSDSTGLIWINDWKYNFSYDTLNKLTESVRYKFMNGAWVPDERSVYGKEPDKPINWNIVQTWNGSKSNWQNKFYYVKQINEEGLTTTEVHLDWGGKEWQINLTVHYIYNDSGELYQILNDSQQVLFERYCRP